MTAEGRWPAGTIVHLDHEASPQFRGNRATQVRIISVDLRPTYPGWAWITGYALGPTGIAVAKRELYVRVDSVKVLSRPAATPAKTPIGARR